MVTCDMYRMQLMTAICSTLRYAFTYTYTMYIHTLCTWVGNVDTYVCTVCFNEYIPPCVNSVYVHTYTIGDIM